MRETERCDGGCNLNLYIGYILYIVKDLCDINGYLQADGPRGEPLPGPPPLPPRAPSRRAWEGATVAIFGNWFPARAAPASRRGRRLASGSSPLTRSEVILCV